MHILLTASCFNSDEGKKTNKTNPHIDGWNWLLAVGFELRVTALDAHLPTSRAGGVAGEY